MKKIVGDFLILINIITFPVAFMLSAILGEVEIFSTMGLVRYSWVALLFLPIPLITLLHSKVLKKSGLKYKNDLIIATVLIIFLSVYGTLWVDLFNVYTYEVKIINKIEEKVSIDLPNEVKIATEKDDNFQLSYVKLLNVEEKTVFENEMITEEYWEIELNENIINLLPYNTIEAEFVNCEYFLFYNNTSKQYNTAPIDSGKYECVLLAYDAELSRLIILNDYLLQIT